MNLCEKGPLFKKKIIMDSKPTNCGRLLQRQVLELGNFILLFTVVRKSFKSLC